MGHRLKRLRQEAGLSQSQLARAAGVPEGSLRNWEQGRREPLFGTAVRLARAMGISLDDLAGPAPAPTSGEGPAKKKGKR
jgi:transcriptional regulator with XRE-family HTH domain